MVLDSFRQQLWDSETQQPYGISVKCTMSESKRTGLKSRTILDANSQTADGYFTIIPDSYYMKAKMEVLQHIEKSIYQLLEDDRSPVPLSVKNGMYGKLMYKYGLPEILDKLDKGSITFDIDGKKYKISVTKINFPQVENYSNLAIQLSSMHYKGFPKL